VAGRIVKTEWPMEDAAALASMVESFEACTLPYKHWTHRAHLAVAIVYVRTFSFDEALNRIRERIRDYNSCCGDPAGYNETITRLFLMRLRHDDLQGLAAAEPHAELARVVATYGVDWLYGYYSKDRIWSSEAATAWMEPDLKPLDFSAEDRISGIG
jgi:hypothetical protein